VEPLDLPAIIEAVRARTATVEQYEALARYALQQFLRSEHAAVWAEVEAKLADVSWGDLPEGIFPHHLTTAKRQLIAAHAIEEITEPTKGGRLIPVLAMVKRPKRAFEDAAARKRVLYARYLSWAMPTGGRPNLVGRGGEQVVRASLRKAMPYGYMPLRLEGGDVNQVFGKPVPGGTFDDAAHLMLLDAEQAPFANVTVLVEVKNVRHWIYPESAELYDLLHKAAHVQLDNPTRSIVPVLACRRVNFPTFRMARDLGFIVIQTKKQFILRMADLDIPHLMEVQQGLGFLDLTPAELTLAESADTYVTRQFSSTIPERALVTARRFAQSAAVIAEFSNELRDPGLPPAHRHNLFRNLRENASELPDYNGGW
jgi:hypothetical protein